MHRSLPPAAFQRARHVLTAPSLQLTQHAPRHAAAPLPQVGCVVIAAKQVDGPTTSMPLPPNADMEAASGLPRSAVDQMEWNIRPVLVQVRAGGGL